MNNVIYVDFKRPVSELENYLAGLRQMGIDDDDVLDLTDAINDFNEYQNADTVIKTLADVWFDKNQM
jgi:hypothetical protein